MTSDGVVPFGYMRLAGGRFDKSLGLPVASAAELERYARLVTAVARELYLGRNPRRQRVPRGFDEAFDLRLTRVEEGSAVPTLVRPAVDDGGLFQNADWHDEARRLINTALADIGKSDRVPANFPLSALKELAQFGRGLHADERIELADSASDPQRATMTTETRNRIQRLARLEELEIETVLVGQVTGLSSTPPHVDVTITEAGQQRRIPGTFSDLAVWDSLRDNLGFGELAAPVSLSVVAAQDRDGVIVRITDILQTEPALPPAWSERLEHLARLKTGWLSEGSEPPSTGVTERVEAILLSCLDSAIGEPAIYPSGDGGIQLEWRTSTRAVEIEVLNAGATEGIWYGQTTNEDGSERSFEAGDPDGVADFVKEAISE